MQHVATLELMACSTENVGARYFRSVKKNCHHILQLISETVRAARLIQCRTPPDPARQRLIEQPPVQHQVHRRLRSLHNDLAKKFLPKVPRLLPGLLDDPRIFEFPNALQGGLLIGLLAKNEINLLDALRRNVQMHLERSARVHTGLHPAGKTYQAQGIGLAPIAQSPQELGAIAGQAMNRLAGGQERDPIRELATVSVSRKQRLRVMIVARDNKGMDVLPIDSQDPFRIIRGRQAPHLRPYVFYTQLNDLNGSAMSNEHIHALNEPLAHVLED